MTPRRHGLADRYLAGWRGIEIGGSLHNGFGLDTLNVDFTDSLDTPFKQEEIRLCGNALPVDVVAEGDALPFDDDAHDFLIASHVAEHFPDPIKAVKEWVRVVRPGGLLFLILPLPDAHPADKGRAVSTLDEIEAAHREGATVATREAPEGHGERGHYFVYSYHSFKAFVARFFADSLEWIDGEKVDRKCGNGHTHVLRVIKPTKDDSPRIDVVPRRTRVWVNLPDDTGCTYYRQYAPLLHCKAELAAQGIDLIEGGLKGTTLPDSSYDAYVLQRATGPAAFTFLHWIRQCKRRLIWDLDDDFLAIPEWSPAYKPVREDGSLLSLPVYLDMADAITVTNRRLADRIEEELDFTRGKLHVLPNLVDATKYEARVPHHRRIPRVMWTGSAYHGADLDLLVPVVDRLVAETEMEVVFVGSMPDVLRRHPEHRVWQVAGTQIRYYPRLLCDVAADVSVIPITGTLFDESKSAIKWMESTLAGAAVVATDFGPYRAAIEHERTGLLIPPSNDPDDWFHAIQRAFVHRRELNAAAREEVLSRHSWQSPARNLWVEFFAEQAALVSR